MSIPLTKGGNSVRFKYSVVFAVTAVFLVILPTCVGPYYQHVLIMILLSAYLAQCWNILSGIAGQFSFGHAAFFGIGAYTSSLLFVDLKIIPWLGIIIGALLCMAIGGGIGYLCFRYGLRGAYFTLAVLAFAEIFRIIVTNVGAFGGSLGILLPLNDSWLFLQFASRIPYYYLALIMTLLITLFTYWLQSSKLGSYFIAIKENEDAAEMLGINTSRYKIIAMCISAFLTAVGGSFYAQYMYYIDPNLAFGVDRSIAILIPAVIGGPGTVFGPLLGAAVLTPLAEITRSYLGDFGGVHLMVYGAIIILVVLFLPQGLIGLLRKVAFYLKNKGAAGKKTMVGVDKDEPFGSYRGY